MTQYSPAFTRAVNHALDPKIEGGLSLDPEDKGNWTGGAKGKGELVGTKYGISAASYPTTDIRGLNREQAVAIYWKDFWSIMKGDQLPPRVALVVFDSAINQGTEVAVKLLQRCLGFVTDDIDGIVGPQTIAGARAIEQNDVITNFLAERGLRYTQAPTWKVHGRGWMRRLFATAAEASR